MPAGEPNVDAPLYYWAGEYDAQQYADALGMSWIAPLFALTTPRVVNIVDLCAAPKPSAPAFTTSDLATGLIPGAGRDAATLKIETFTNAALWDTFCHPADDPAPEPDPPQPPPPDLPEGPMPETAGDKLHREMHAWIKWWVRNALPRTAVLKFEFICSDEGYEELPRLDDGEWPVYACGIDVTVNEKPPNTGRTMGGDFPVWYSLGWMTIGAVGGGQPPVRLQHDHLIITNSNAAVTGFFWNLTPGVSVTVKALYPTTATMPPGG